MKEFKLIVAGGRDFTDYNLVKQEIHVIAYGDQHAVSIVSGMARGADSLGVRFAKENNVVLHEFPADWELFGKSAGYVRNMLMAEFADGLLAFWDGKSRGTKHMITCMQSLRKPVVLIDY